jgi:hypothetical protein
MSTFMRVVIEMVSGTFDDWRDRDDPNILARGITPLTHTPAEAVPPAIHDEIRAARAVHNHARVSRHQRLAVERAAVPPRPIYCQVCSGLIDPVDSRFMSPLGHFHFSCASPDVILDAYTRGSAARSAGRVSKEIRRADRLDSPKVDRASDDLLWIRDAPSLKELSQRVSPEAMRRAVARATDEDFIRARNEIRALFSSPSIASLGLGKVAEDLTEGPWGQKAVVLVWLVFRRGHRGPPVIHPLRNRVNSKTETSNRQ